MCDLNGPFRLCTCSSNLDYSEPHWILHKNGTNEGEDNNGYKFTFKKDKWVLEEWYGEHPIFEHQILKEGVIDLPPSELKEVCKRYLNVLNEGEMDIVDCGWSNYRMSEKSLIDFMERRIRGENVKFPDDYFPLRI